METEELQQFFAATWSSTIKRCKSSLDEDDQDVIDEYKTWEAVDKWLASSALSSITIIRPALSHLNIFVKFIITHLGPSVETQYLWGSLACLLKLVSRNLRFLEQIPRMIKSLVFKAEAFNGYCKRITGTSNAINEVSFDMLLQFVGFFTSSIKHIHGTGSIGERQNIQQLIQRQYEMTTLELSEFLSRLEKLIIAEGPINTPPVELPIRELVMKERCLMLPMTKTNRLFDRIDVFVKLDELLTPDAGESPLQSVALHGIGGVGKTSIASSYAEEKFSKKVYDVVLWVCGETDVSMRQSFTDISLRLKLPGAQPQTHDENRILVMDWFHTTASKWLIIFDNVETPSVLAPYWPRSSPRGRAIITTRNHSLALDPAASGLEVEHWDTEMGAQYLLFLLKRAIGRDLDSESASARTLAEKLSGHALAISQMAGLIYDGEYTIQDFTAMYLENPHSAHAMSEFAALWDFAFQSLDKNSFSLLGILSFLMPDNIQPEILEPKNNQDLPEGLKFLKDKFTGFSAAKRKLTTRALIKRDKDSGVLTVHRLIQTQFRYSLSIEQRQKAFNDTVTLMSLVLPNSDIEQGQLYGTWEVYNKYMQHILRLRDIFEEERKASSEFTAPKLFCEILNDYQRFLLEGFSFEECERTCMINRDAASTLTSREDRINLQAAIISHQAQVLDNLGNPQKAAVVCQEEIDIRLGESPKKHILLAYSACNLGIMYSSANDFPKASEAFSASHRWWDLHFTSKGEVKQFAPSILVYEARGLIGLGKLKEAEEMIKETIKLVKEEKPLNFGSLAFASFYFGILDRHRNEYVSAEAHFMDAQNAWLKHDQAHAHPFNAGILYNIGVCCLEQKKISASIKFLKDSLKITELFDRALPVENGRNYFQLSRALEQDADHNAAEVATLMTKAEVCLKKKKPDVTDSGIESAYNDLITVEWR